MMASGLSVALAVFDQLSHAVSPVIINESNPVARTGAQNPPLTDASHSPSSPSPLRVEMCRLAPSIARRALWRRGAGLHRLSRLADGRDPRLTRAASGHHAAAPPSSAMNSRRLRSSMRLPPQVPPPSYARPRCLGSVGLPHLQLADGGLNRPWDIGMAEVACLAARVGGVA